MYNTQLCTLTEQTCRGVLELTSEFQGGKRKRKNSKIKPNEMVFLLLRAVMTE